MCGHLSDPARSPKEAYERYFEHLRETLQCVTDGVLITNVRPAVGLEATFGFSTNPAPLRRIPWALYLLQRYTIARDEDDEHAFKVRTLKYTYAIEGKKDRKELLSFHWANGSEPHIHVGFAAKEFGAPMDKKLHIPSGRVAIESVVRFLIEEMGAEPRKAAWREILSERLNIFKQYKRW